MQIILVQFHSVKMQMIYRIKNIPNALGHILGNYKTNSNVLRSVKSTFTSFCSNQPYHLAVSLINEPIKSDTISICTF